MLIQFDKPLDLVNTLESGQSFRWHREDPSQPGEGQWYYGVVFDNIVKIRREGSIIEYFCSPADEADLEPMIRDYFALSDNLESIHQSIAIDDHMKEAISLYPGIRLLRQAPWETLISFICSSNSNIPRITANIESIATNFGRRLTLGDHVRGSFPTPNTLVQAGENNLRALGLGFRAKYVTAVANTIGSGKLNLDELKETNYAHTLQVLTSLPGVGDKVANCVMLFSLNKLEAFPVDVWIDRAIQEWYLHGTGVKLNRKDMRAWAQAQFGPYAGYANHYLFHGRRLQNKR